MHVLRNAVLAYGLVSVPVGVCTATKKRAVSFKTIHRDCGGSVGQHYVCKVCGKIAGTGETTKGYEVAKGHVIEVDMDKLDELNGSSSEIVEIEKFVPADQFDELQVADSYYLKPDVKHPFFVGAYMQIAQAMGAEVVGLGSAHLWAKEMPCAVWAKPNGVLVLSRLYCHDEVVDDSELVTMFTQEIPESHMELANMLVAAKMGDLVASQDLVSGQRNEIENYLAALVAGENYTVERQPEREVVVMDMEQLLRQSIEAARA